MCRVDDQLVALMDALSAVERSAEVRATSVRIPEGLHRAVLLATELGMDESFTAATSRALEDRLRTFVRRRALAEHFAAFPTDLPTLAAVCHRRVRGSGHAGESHPDLVDEAAAWVEQRRPEWAVTGAVDEAVDEVLGHVELLASRAAQARPRSA